MKKTIINFYSKIKTKNPKNSVSYLKGCSFLVFVIFFLSCSKNVKLRTTVYTTFQHDSIQALKEGYYLMQQISNDTYIFSLNNKLRILNRQIKNTNVRRSVLQGTATYHVFSGVSIQAGVMHPEAPEIVNDETFDEVAVNTSAITGFSQINVRHTDNSPMYFYTEGQPFYLWVSPSSGKTLEYKVTGDFSQFDAAIEFDPVACIVKL